MLAVFDDEKGKAAVSDLVKQWKGLTKLEAKHQSYVEAADADLKTRTDINKKNQEQQ